MSIRFRWGCVLLILTGATACNVVSQNGASDPGGRLLTGSDQSGLQPAPDDQTVFPELGGDANAAAVVDEPTTPSGQPPIVVAPTPAPDVAAPTQGALYTEKRYPWALVGRFDMTDPNAPRFGFIGSKIGVRFTGTSLSVLFADSGVDAFNVVVDGVEYVTPLNPWTTAAQTPTACRPATEVAAYNGNDYPACLLLNKSANLKTPTLYPVVSGLANGEHTAWLTKRTEFLQNGVGNVQFFGFQLDDGAKLLSPPPYYQRRIEVTGDSSVTGYGAAQRAPCNYSIRNSDGGRSMPAYLGSALHSEIVNLSSSGQGVYLSYYDRNGNHNLPTIYRQRVPLEPTPYDFSLDHVDVVVLNAGGDDLFGKSGAGYFSNGDGVSADGARENFIAAYTNWLAEIRQKRPDATIFCALTAAAIRPDIALLGDAIMQAVANRTSAGDANVVYFTHFPANDPVRNPRGYVSIFDAAKAPNNLPFGCSGHAGPPMSNYLANSIGRVIAQRMGWTDVTLTVPF